MIGVVALLVALLLPALANARRAGRTVACANNLRNLGHGAYMYANDFNGAIPWEGYAEGDRAIRHVGDWEDPSQWFNAMPKYAGLRPYCELQADDAAGRARLPRNGGGDYILICPEAGDATAVHLNDLVQDGFFMLWGCKPDYATSDRRKTYWCYAYNTQLDGGIEDRHRPDRRVTLFMHSFNRASETVLLLEKLMRTKEFDPPFQSEIGQGEMGWNGFTTRHNGGGHLLFLDGHVACHKRSEITNPPAGAADHNQSGIVWNPAGLSL